MQAFPFSKSILLLMSCVLLFGGCDLISQGEEDEEDNEPQDFGVLIENRSTTPLSIIVAPNEEFSDDNHLLAGETRLVGVRGVRRGDVVFFEAAVRGIGIPWETIAVRQCTFDGDLDKFRQVFYRGGLGCENW